MTSKETKNSDSVLTEIYKTYKDDPIFFCEHALGHLTWGKHRQILQSVRDNEKTAVKACHGVSKTYAAAEIVTWFLNCFENSKVITTAPTFLQVKELLWAEIGAIYRTSRIKLDGECLTMRINTDKSEHYAIGFSTDKPQRAEGWHAPAILFIFDEAKGIPPWLWDSVKGLMTGGFCRWLAISTTDGVTPGDQYEKCFKLDSNWEKIHISAFESPYVTGEKFRGIKIPDLERLDKFEPHYVDPKDINIQIATPKWIKECEKDWGKDSVLYNTKVLGEIDEGGADTIIKLSQVMKMFENAKKEDFDDSGAIEAGVDVAWGGADDSVFFKRQGLKVIDKKVIPPKDMPLKAKLVYVSDKLEPFVDYSKEVLIKVDSTGVGAGVVDIMQDREYDIFPISFQQDALRKKRYANAISEAWYEVAKIIDEISCPQDNRLQTELVNRKGGHDKKGRLIVESKDEYKKRAGQDNRDARSPDMADAFLLCFYNRSLGGGVYVLGGKEAEEKDADFASAMGDDDWEQRVAEQRKKRQKEGKEEPGDLDIKLSELRRPEIAQKYLELSREGKAIDEIAKELGIEPSLLRRFVGEYREYILDVGKGGGTDSGRKKIEIV